MTKSHLKRLFAPKTWKLNRKTITFILRPNPGAHKMQLAETLNMFIIESGKASNKKEVNYILNNHQVIVDGKQRKDRAFSVGLFDLISYPELNETYTLVMNKLGKLQIVKVDSALNSRIVSIKSKKKIRGNKLQVFTKCGRTLLTEDKFDKDYSVGDSLRIELPTQKVLAHVKFEKGAEVFTFAGSHKGISAVIQKIENTRIFCKFKEIEFETNNYSIIVIDDKMKKLLQTID